MSSKKELAKESAKLRYELAVSQKDKRDLIDTLAESEGKRGELQQKLEDAEVDNREQAAHITRLLQEAVALEFNVVQGRLDAFTEKINLVRSAYSSRDEKLPDLPDIPRIWGEIEIDGEIVHAGPVVRLSKFFIPGNWSPFLPFEGTPPREEIHIGFDGDPKNYVVRTDMGGRLTLRTPVRG